MTVSRFDFLGDIEDVLWDATQQTITESLQRGESPDHGDAGNQDCAWCGHAWHGLSCRPLRQVGPFVAVDPHGCDCAGAHRPVDDTWRPPLTKVQKLMRDEGLDGYAAIAQLKAGCYCFSCVTERAARRHRRSDHSFARVTLDRFNEAVRQVTEVMNLTASQAQLMAQSLADLRQSRDAETRPKPIETDPRRRALAHRQQLGTGPTRASAGQARRPSRISTGWGARQLTTGWSAR